jgi:hypothetical protein
MRFVQCEASVTTRSGKELDDLLLNARVLGRCHYDLDGRMTHG